MISPQDPVYARSARLIEGASPALHLDLQGAVVLTEAATNAYDTTPVIAAMAGSSDLYALARDSTIESLRRGTWPSWGGDGAVVAEYLAEGPVLDGTQQVLEELAASSPGPVVVQFAGALPLPRLRALGFRIHPGEPPADGG